MTAVRIDGITEAIAALGRVAQAAKRTALAEAATAGLEPILADAKRRVPRLSGDLERSLKVQVWEASENKVELEVYSDPEVAFYGPMVEYGTRYSTGQPFLRPAFDAHKGEAEDRVAQILGSRIERAAT